MKAPFALPTGLTGQGGSRAIGTTLRDLATILQWEQTDTAQVVHLLEVWRNDFQAYHHLLNVISFSTWKEVISVPTM